MNKAVSLKLLLIIVILAAASVVVHVLRAERTDSTVTTAGSSVTETVPEVTTETRAAPAGDVFDEHRLSISNELNKAVGQSLAQKLRNILRKNNCTNEHVQLYSKSGIPEKLLVTECFRLITAASKDTEAVREVEYPIMFALMGGQLHELVRLNDYAFMYESGTLMAVTSLNQDGNLQLWLDGYVCENDGESEAVLPGSKPEPVSDCRGTRVVEIINGELREYQP